MTGIGLFQDDHAAVVAEFPRKLAAPDIHGVNAPGATVCASVTVPCGTDSDVRLSHVAADAGGTHATNTAANSAQMMDPVDLMRRSVAHFLVR